MAESEELQEIIAGCIRYEKASQEKLYKQFYGALFSLCRRLLPNDHEAIEVVNDGMLKVFQNIGSYQQGKARLFTWAYTIVRNTAIDKLRKSVTLPAVDPVGLKDILIEESAAANPLKWLEGRDLTAIFEQLPPPLRTVATLFYFEGYKVTEIADALGINEGTVKWYLSEARKKLKPIFEKYVSQ
jgi:RNA polymerase sigma factor (sigma-70 family)